MLVRSFSSKSLKDALPLEEFLFRLRVKKVYRDALRQIYASPQKDDLLTFLKHEWVKEPIPDKSQRQYMLSQGTKQIEQIAQSMNLAKK